MSSDNFYLIRKIGGRYVVDEGTMSDDGEFRPPDKCSRWFDTFEQAALYANSEYSEYGIVLGEGLMDYGGGLPGGDAL